MQLSLLLLLFSVPQLQFVHSQELRRDNTIDCENVAQYVSSYDENIESELKVLDAVRAEKKYIDSDDSVS